MDKAEEELRAAYFHAGTIYPYPGCSHEEAAEAEARIEAALAAYVAAVRAAERAAERRRCVEEVRARATSERITADRRGLGWGEPDHAADVLFDLAERMGGDRG